MTKETTQLLEEIIKQHNETIELLTKRLEVTQKKLTESIQKSEYLEHIIDVLPGNVYWSDKNHVLMGVNNALVKISGLPSKADIIGKTNYDLPWSNLAHEYNRVNQQVLDTRETIITEENLDVDGFKTYITIKAPLLDKQNNLIGVVGISYDISDRKLQEIELKKAKEDAEVANKAKTEFIMNISHDIRTPFSGIIGLSEYLEQGETDEKKRDALQDISTSGKKVLGLINNIIELIKREPHELIQESEFNVRDLINEIMDLIKAKIKEKGLQITVHIDRQLPTTIISKKEILNRILLNLVSNAIKFTQHGAITISVNVINLSDNILLVKLNVSDTGIGISNEKKEAIFEKFTRLNPSYLGTYQGTGLGLWLVKNAVEQLNGTISVESEVAKGSTFTCTFECQTGTGLQGITQKEPTPKGKADNKQLISILLVEDEPIAGKAATLLLTSYFNCKITHTTMAAEAIEYIKNQPFDLMLVDIGLPDLSGVELAKILDSYQPNTPIVGLTAHAQAELSESEQQAFSYVLEKPLNRTLCAMLEKSLFFRGA